MSHKTKLSFIEKIVLVILQDNPKGTLNAQRVFSRISPDNQLTKDDIYKALLSLTQKKLADQPSKGNFAYVKPIESLVGVLSFNSKNEAYLVLEDKTSYYINNKLVKHYLPGDIVEFEFKKKGKRIDIVSLELKERNPQKVVGFLDVFENRAFLLSTKHGFKDIQITHPVSEELDGHKATVLVTDYPRNSRLPIGKIIEVFGKPGENDTEMHAIVSEFGFSVQFPSEVLDEAENISEVISDSEISKRKDLRNILTFTIDPVDAKDFDDAISFQKHENGHITLGVHIADVSHFVKKNSPLDTEAINRGTSVYLVDRTIPMLPEKLSNNLCSLKPNVDRLAFSVLFELSNTGEILDQWIGKTVIHSDRRFSYEEAQQRIVDKSGDFWEELNELNSIAKKFEVERYNNGALKFESKELRFKLDDKGKPLEIIEKQRFDAHKLIETYMLLANKAVAEYVYKLKKPTPPFIYRTHDQPPPDKLIEFAKFTKSLGYSIQIDNERVLRKSFNSLQEKSAGKPEEELIQQMAIRSMAKAVYTSQKTSHFGLAFDYYTHFTSPIRRYPDLLAHRILFDYLNARESSSNFSEIEALAKHSSNMEQKAADAERASIKYKMAEYVKNFEGQLFEARISGITEWGIYATIIDLHAEGLIKLSDIRFDRFYFIENERKLVGKRTKRSFHLGDIITIKVKSANPLSRQIDFYLYD